MDQTFRQQKHLIQQIGLIILVVILLGVSSSLRYVPLSTEMTDALL